MTVKVADLKDQIGQKGPRNVLVCFSCGAQCSANRGDYWNHPLDFEFRCLDCDEPLHLGHFIQKFVEEKHD